jgi:hypothetical protein
MPPAADDQRLDVALTWPDDEWPAVKARLEARVARR